MAELKTKLNDASVEGFLNKIADEKRRKDCFTVVKLMKSATKAEPKMWGAAIVGFGNLHLKYESGRELDWFQMGFSPRKQNLTLYGLGISKNPELLKKLGKHKTGKGCLYVNSLDEINMDALKEMIEKTAKTKKK